MTAIAYAEPDLLTAPLRRTSSSTGAAPPEMRLTCPLRELRLSFDGGSLLVQFSGDLPIWLASVAKALVSLSSLGRGWDSFSAEPVGPACIVAALDVALVVMRDTSPPPAVVPTVHGGVQLEWHLRDIDLEVEVASPNRIEGYFEDHRTKRTWELDLSTDLSPLRSAVAELTNRG